jgi:hypothetical protein
MHRDDSARVKDLGMTLALSCDAVVLDHSVHQLPADRLDTQGRVNREQRRMRSCRHGVRPFSPQRALPRHVAASGDERHGATSRTRTAGRAMSCCTEGRAAARVVSMAVTVSRRSVE